jgi:hypothetical protein
LRRRGLDSSASLSWDRREPAFRKCLAARPHAGDHEHQLDGWMRAATDIRAIPGCRLLLRCRGHSRGACLLGIDLQGARGLARAAMGDLGLGAGFWGPSRRLARFGGVGRRDDRRPVFRRGSQTSRRDPGLDCRPWSKRRSSSDHGARPWLAQFSGVRIPHSSLMILSYAVLTAGSARDMTTSVWTGCEAGMGLPPFPCAGSQALGSTCTSKRRSSSCKAGGAS